MRLRSKRTGSNGFTLVEVIITLVAAGFMAVLFIHYMGTALDFSWKSVEFVAGEAEAEGKLEEIIAYYTSKINADPETALASTKGEFESSIVTMKYIAFDSAGNETTVTLGTSNNLKVTVAAPGNDLITVLTRSRNESTDPKVNY